jgi:1-deoxy-D-xylulose-5-phosphate reductoisomerase
VFNAANEAAVALFLDGRIQFADIPRAIESALAAHSDMPSESREALITADGESRRHVTELFAC